MRFFHKRVCIFDKMSSKMLSNLIVSKIAKTIHDNDPLAVRHIYLVQEPEEIQNQILIGIFSFS